MTREQYLLQCLSEECAEVQLIASKYNRFGPESFHPDDPKKLNNRFRLTHEIVDLMALIQAVGMNGMLDPMDPEGAEKGIQDKLKRLDGYMVISEDLGTLQKDPAPEDLNQLQFPTTPKTTD